jgi:rubrerythrin
MRKLKHYKPGHLYECYECGGKKYLALYERQKCKECNYIWNENNNGEDCPQCGGNPITIINSLVPDKK